MSLRTILIEDHRLEFVAVLDKHRTEYRDKANYPWIWDDRYNNWEMAICKHEKPTEALK